MATPSAGAACALVTLSFAAATCGGCLGFQTQRARRQKVPQGSASQLERALSARDRKQAEQRRKPPAAIMVDKAIGTHEPPQETPELVPEPIQDAAGGCVDRGTPESVPEVGEEGGEEGGMEGGIGKEGLLGAPFDMPASPEATTTASSSPSGRSSSGPPATQVSPTPTSLSQKRAPPASTPPRTGRECRVIYEAPSSGSSTTGAGGASRASTPKSALGQRYPMLRASAAALRERPPPQQKAPAASLRRAASVLAPTERCASSAAALRPDSAASRQLHGRSARAQGTQPHSPLSSPGSSTRSLDSLAAMPTKRSTQALGLGARTWHGEDFAKANSSSTTARRRVVAFGSSAPAWRGVPFPKAAASSGRASVPQRSGAPPRSASTKGCASSPTVLP